MLAWAEQHRNLADSLHLAGDMYEARARSQAGFAALLFGALTLIFVVFGFGMTVISLFLPMFTLISRLSG
jgi:general secretion pathway protein F